MTSIVVNLCRECDDCGYSATIATGTDDEWKDGTLARIADGSRIFTRHEGEDLCPACVHRARVYVHPACHE